MSKNSTKTIFSFLLFSAIFAFIAACGDGSSTEASNNGSTMESTWVSLDNVDSSDAVMAMKTLNNGIKLHFDKRELKGKEISVNYRKAMPESLQENAFGLTIYAGVEFAPGGLTFDVPIEVTLPLNKKPDTDSLLVLYYNEKERVWEATDMAVVQGKNVVFHVNHFSLYAVVDKNINDMLDYFDKLINDATDNLEKCPGEEKLTKEVKKFVDYIDGKDGYNLAEARGIITYPKTSCGKVEGYFASAQIYNDSEKKESFCFGGDSKKEDTDHLTLIHKTDSQMGKKEKSSSEYQKIFDRGFSIFYGPTESTLEATASTTSLGEGETATINISNMCGDDPMEGYVIKVKTSGNMEKVDKGDIVIGSDGKATLKVKMTDASENGWVELTTTSLADEKLVTKQKIEFEADTSTAETWEMSLDVTEEHDVCSVSECLIRTFYEVNATFIVEPYDYIRYLEDVKSMFSSSQKDKEIIEYISNLPSSVQELIYNSLLETNNLKIEEISENFEENLINNLTYDELERILLNEKEIMPLNIIFSSTPKMTIKSVSVENDYKADVVEYTNPGEYPTVRFPGDYLKRNEIRSVKETSFDNLGQFLSAKASQEENTSKIYFQFDGSSVSYEEELLRETLYGNLIFDNEHPDGIFIEDEDKESFLDSEKLLINPVVVFTLKEGSFSFAQTKKENFNKEKSSVVVCDWHLTNTNLSAQLNRCDLISQYDTEASGTLTLKRIK